MKYSLYPSLSAFALALGTITMVGCGGAASFSNPTSTGTPPPPTSTPQVVAGPAVQGSVYGGHAPLGGAHVYLLQPGTAGPGSAATSLLGVGPAVTTTSPGGFTLTANVNDPNVVGSAMYETTDVNGNFNFTGAYGCTVGQPVYVYAWGGNIGGGAKNNSNIVQLATLGNCPSSGNFSTTGNGALSFVYLNEVSTVATAYTFQPFTSATNNNAWDIGTSNTTQGLLGIANAANTAAQLYNIQGGTQISTTQQGEGHIANYQTQLTGVPNDGNGVVPQATIDTLANIAAACVDSSVVAVGTPTAICSSLFNVARDNGETTGTEPTDTATALINISRFPAGNNSVTAVDGTYAHDIFVLQGATVPYVPDLTTAPNDWTIAINYPGPNNGVTGSASGGKVTNSTLNSAESIAIDSIGQVWITSQGNPATGGGFINNPDIVRWSSLGAQNAINTYSYIPGYVSVDGSNNAWTGNANDAPAAAPYVGNGGTGTSIFEDGSNGVFTNPNGSGYYKAYVVITDKPGDVFFFAGASTLAGNYDMWEYPPGGGTLDAGSPTDINTTTTTGPVTQNLTITAASETNSGGTYTYSFNFTYVGGTPATPLAVGDTVPLVLANDPGTGAHPTAATGWGSLTSVTVASVSGTSFTATGTTHTTNSNDGNGAATTAAINITAATETKAGSTYTYTFAFTNVGTPGVPLAVGDIVPVALTNDPGTGTPKVAATGWNNLTSVTVATVNSTTNPTSFTATGTTATTNTVSTNTNSPTEAVTITGATETHTGGTYTYTFDYTLPAGSPALGVGDVVPLALTNAAGSGTSPVAATGWQNLTSVTVASVTGTQFTATGTTPTTNSSGTATATINITAATETNTTRRGVTTYTYTFTYNTVGTPTALAAGDTVTLALANAPAGLFGAAATGWQNLTSVTVASVTGTTTFTATGTTATTDSTGLGGGNGATGTGTYPYTGSGNGATGSGTLLIDGATGTGSFTYTNANGATGTGSYTYTGTITTLGAIPAGDNVGHGAIDSAGHLWLTAETPGNTIARISPTGVPDFTSIVTTEQPEFPAIDAANNAWIAIQQTAAQVDVVSPAGGLTVLTPTGTGGTTATGALMTSTFGAAVDGNGNVWFANRAGNYGAVGPTAAGQNTIFVLNGGVSTDGTLYNAISPPTNYVPETEYAGATTYTKILDGSLNLAIDPSGNVWITNYTGGGVVELVGAAAPVVTPLSVAAGNGQLGQKP